MLTRAGPERDELIAKIDSALTGEGRGFDIATLTIYPMARRANRYDLRNRSELCAGVLLGQAQDKAESDRYFREQVHSYHAHCDLRRHYIVSRTYPTDIDLDQLPAL